MPGEVERVYTARQAAELLGYQASSLRDRRVLQRLGLRVTRVGKSVRFLASDLTRTMQPEPRRPEDVRR
jgi:hypothetical protein